MTRPEPTSRGQSVAVMGVLCALILGTGTAAAQVDPAGAEAMFRRAQQLMKEGKLAEACPKFDEAFRLEPTGRAAFEHARCLEAQGRTAGAWARYAEARTFARKKGNAQMDQEITGRIDALEKALSKLTVTVSARVVGLTVKRDGVALGEGSWGSAMPVDPGPHVVEATAPGKRARSVTVQVTAGQDAAVSVPSLEDDATQTPGGVPGPRAPTPVTSPGGGGNTQRTIGYVLGGVGLVGVVFGAVELLSAKSVQSSIDTRFGSGCKGACDELHSLESDRDGKNTLGLLGVAGGGAALAVGIVLLVTARADDAPPAVALRLRAATTADGGWVKLVGTW